MRPADSGVKIDTVKSWICLLDPREKWLNDCDKNHMWTRPVCNKFEYRKLALRNFSKAFISGISGSASKKDNVKKHVLLGQHKRAEAISASPSSINDIDIL